LQLGAGMTQAVPAAFNTCGSWQVSGGAVHSPVAVLIVNGSTHGADKLTQFAPEAMSGTGHVQPAPAGIWGAAHCVLLGGITHTPAAFTLAAALPLQPAALAVLEVATLAIFVAAGSLPPPPQPESATVRRTASTQSTDDMSAQVRSLPTAASPTKRVGG